MEQILPAYGLSKETVTTVMMLYRNTIVKVRSPDGDTNFFDIIAGKKQRKKQRKKEAKRNISPISVYNQPRQRT